LGYRAAIKVVDHHYLLSWDDLRCELERLLLLTLTLPARAAHSVVLVI
jgi:hypothetical protein